VVKESTQETAYAGRRGELKNQTLRVEGGKGGSYNREIKSS